MAEIIIFPGIRYERLSELPTAKRKRSRKARVKRDHLRIKA
jgi:ribosomal protein S21